MQKTICELFAGVGGFRLGFDRLESGWKTTWFSQWEPGARTQWAHNCYVQDVYKRQVTTGGRGGGATATPVCGRTHYHVMSLTKPIL